MTDFAPGDRVRWRSAPRDFVDTGDAGTVLRTRQTGSTMSVTIRWDKVIQSKSGKAMNPVTPVSSLDLERMT